MKSHVLWIAAVFLCLAACGKQETPEQEASTEAAPPSAEPHAEVDQAFLDHMHDHADQLDDLMFALADDDLEAANTPAYWLARHETVSGIPEEWRQYVVAMRESAAKVEAATDLESARVAAEQISVHCQECHAAAGINALQ